MYIDIKLFKVDSCFFYVILILKKSFKLKYSHIGNVKKYIVFSVQGKFTYYTD